MRSVLIVVDYQRDFVCGSLGFKGAEALDDIICGKIAEYRKEGGTIVFTMDTHEKNYLQTREGKNLPVEHCIRGSEGWRIYGNTAEMKKAEDVVFEKNSFPSAELMTFLQKEGFDKAELCGLVSNICVLSNAVIAKAALPEAEIVVDAKATAAADDEMTRKAFDILEGIQVTVINR